MAKLIVNPTSPSRREIALSRTLLSIGRDPSNDVVLPDAMVSRRHAVIEYRGSQYFLRDCNSSNGSLINGDRISERGLRDGDLVAIGTARLLFRDDLVTEDAAGKVIHHPSAPRQQCPTCHQDYRRGDLFCRHCGASLAPQAPSRTICSACGTAVPLPARFCTACGSRLLEGPAGDEAAPAPPLEAPGEMEAVLAQPAAPGEGGEAGGAAASAEAERQPAPDHVDEPEPEAEPPAPPGPHHLQSTADELPFPLLPPPRGEPEGSHKAAPPSLRGRAAASATPSASTAHAVAPNPPPRPAPAPPPPPLAVVRQAEARRDEPARALPAPPLARLAAALVDFGLVGAAQALLSLPALLYWMSSAQRAEEPPSEVPFLPIFFSVALAALAAILGAVYYVYFWGVKGATPGKRLLRLVVQGQDGRQPIGTARAGLRLLGYFVSGLVLGIGFLMIAFGGGGLHDQIAGTRVVRRQGA